MPKTSQDQSAKLLRTYQKTSVSASSVGHDPHSPDAPQTGSRHIKYVTPNNDNNHTLATLPMLSGVLFPCVTTLLSRVIRTEFPQRADMLSSQRHHFKPAFSCVVSCHLVFDVNER